MGTAKAFFLGTEIATDRRSDPPDLQKAGRREGLFQLLREFARKFRDILRVIAADRLKRGVHAIPLDQPNRRNQGYLARRTGLTQLHKLISARERQGPKKTCLDGGEHGAVGADAKGQRHDNGGGEHRGFRQAAQRVAEISQDRFQPTGDIDVARSLHLQCKISELFPCISNRLVHAKAACPQVIRALREVKRQFAVDVSLNAVAAEHVTETVISSHDPSSALGVPNHTLDSLGEPRPAFLFPNELLPPFGSQRVETGLPILLGKAPFGPYPAFLLHPVKRRVE